MLSIVARLGIRGLMNHVSYPMMEYSVHPDPQSKATLSLNICRFLRRYFPTAASGTAVFSLSSSPADPSPFPPPLAGTFAALASFAARLRLRILCTGPTAMRSAI